MQLSPISLAITAFRNSGVSGASLSLDFLSGNQVLDPRITFTRTTEATRTNAAGLIESAAINGARFDYDPVTLAPKGLLIEEQRVNLFLQSQDFTTTWANTGTTETADTSVAPDGTTTADTLTENSSGTGQAAISQSHSFTAGVSYTFSIFIKQGTQTFAQLFFGSGAFGANAYANFNVTTGLGAVGTVGSSATASIFDFGNGWYRCTISATATTTASVGAQLNIIESTTAARAPSITLDSGTILLWGAQLEAGAFPTSYIPTVASQVTRTADNATMTGTNFSSWYNATEGTMYASYSIPFDSSVSAFPIVAAITDGTFANAIVSYLRTVDDTARQSVRVGGVAQTDITSGGTYVYGTTAKQASAYKVNDFAMSVNGAAIGADTSGTVPVVDRMGLGGSLVTGGSLGYLNGHIKKIAFYPRRLTNAELQAITS